MKILYTFLVGLLLLTSCKSDKQENTQTSVEKRELTIADKIANAHGFENWKNVSEVKFTFKVDRDSVKGKGRTWTWKPKTDEISLVTGNRTINYNRNSIDSASISADQAFINDKYWLLVPFQLVWDSSAQLSVSKFTEAPISKTKMNMITITYPKEGGGYTPGDAYDIYYDSDFKIKEWVFRKGNASDPTLTTTFENHQDFNGIKIAIDHKQEGGNWNLNFTDVAITLD